MSFTCRRACFSPRIRNESSHRRQTRTPFFPALAGADHRGPAGLAAGLYDLGLGGTEALVPCLGERAGVRPAGRNIRGGGAAHRERSGFLDRPAVSGLSGPAMAEFGPRAVFRRGLSTVDVYAAALAGVAVFILPQRCPPDAGVVFPGLGHCGGAARADPEPACGTQAADAGGVQRGGVGAVRGDSICHRDAGHFLGAAAEEPFFRRLRLWQPHGALFRADGGDGVRPALSRSV